jgi:Peroxiredoxin
MKKAFVLLFSILIFELSASANNPVQKKGDNTFQKNVNTKTNITGRILNAKNGRVIVKFYPYYFARRASLDATNYEQTIVDGEFDLIISKFDRPAYVSIEILTDIDTTSFNLYLIEPGDSICIYKTSEQIVFSGNGSEKFNCQYEVNSIPSFKWNFQQTEMYARRNGLPWHGYKYLKRVNEIYDSIYLLKVKTIEKYKQKIKRDIIDRLLVDVRGEQLAKFYYQFSILINSADTALRNEQAKYYKTNFLNHQFEKLYNQNFISESNYFADVLVDKIKIDLLVSKLHYSDGRLPKIKLQDIYNSIIKRYGGTLRERLLTTCFTKGYIEKEDKMIELLGDALRVVTNPYFKNILLHIQNAKLAGKPVYDFALPDTSNNIIYLHDLRGKVILVDFWFTGCRPCIKLARNIDEEVLPQFDGDSSVIFLSINMDKQRSVWINSIKEGKYTTKKSINLYTEGLGFNHPCVKHYDIVGAPALLLIDKNGKIVSSNPPKEAKRLVEMIRSVLNH